MFPILLPLGPLTLHTYGFLVALAFLAALGIARIQFHRYGLPADRLDALVFYLMFFGLLGARVTYFAVDHFVELRNDPVQFFRIWEGGLVLYGAVLAGLMVLTLFSYRYNLPFLSLSDSMAAPLLLGQSMGRLGCFAAGCCFGTRTNFPIHVIFKHPDSLAPRFAPLHPTQIYEALGDFILFLLAMILSRKRLRAGSLSAFYLLGYGAFRFLMEFLRGDDRGIFIGRFSPSQGVALMMMLAGVGVLFYGKERKIN